MQSFKLGGSVRDKKAAWQRLSTEAIGKGGRKGRAVRSLLSHLPAELFEVLADQLRHLEHVDRRLTAEDALQGRIGLDHALVLDVLQLVLLDVGPQLLRDLGPRDRLGAD